MDEMKTFQGKTLDEAIHNACVYFDAQREKLEIDIVEDAKSGLFGIVGVRKATIKARRVSLPDNMDRLLERPTVKPEMPAPASVEAPADTTPEAEAVHPEKACKECSNEARCDAPKEKSASAPVKESAPRSERSPRPPKLSSFEAKFYKD